MPDAFGAFMAALRPLTPVAAGEAARAPTPASALQTDARPDGLLEMGNDNVEGEMETDLFQSVDMGIAFSAQNSNVLRQLDAMLAYPAKEGEDPAAEDDPVGSATGEAAANVEGPTAVNTQL